MIQNRRFPPKLMLTYALPIAGLSGLWALIVWFAHAWLDLTFIRIPFLPIATIGTAVAFYVGFKNNASYERFWEGRKIWGGVVNTSRTWAAAVLAYVDPGKEGGEADAVRQELIYRQIAWINALRLQLRRKSRFFDKPARATKARLDAHGDHMRNDWQTELSPFLSESELAEVTPKANAAAQLVRIQGLRLAELVREGRLDLFHQIALMESLTELYTLQGKCERIKNTPFPRQYAEYSRVFTRVFLFLVPFGLLDVFGKHVEAATWSSDSLLAIVPMVVASMLVSWVFFTMEGIGDASEDPFERSMNDVPMNALCRGIEIDLRQMLGETEVPSGEVAIDGILY